MRDILDLDRYPLGRPGTADWHALVARWRPLQSVLAIFDCAGNASVAVEEGVRLTPEGALEGGTWTELEASDPVLRTVCAAAEGGDNDRSNGT